MNYWIFQAVSEKYPLLEKLVEGVAEIWRAPQYRGRMSPDDMVFFWLGGPEKVRGIYGWGRLKSFPYIKPEWEEHVVEVLYEKRLAPYISIHEVKSVRDLQNLLILRAPQATNFPLTLEEARAIVSLVSVR
jgi:hypothetical protein